MYLCDNCDIAGFIEVNYEKWAFELSSSKDTIEGACKGLVRGLTYSNECDCIFVRNFLKHQKNLPLNENNKAHIGIIKRFNIYSCKFNIENIEEFIEGASKGLQSPTGIGIGIGNGKVLIPWRENFEIYLKELNEAYELFIKDEKTIKEQTEFNPNLNIKLTVKKSVVNYWGIAAGWKNKKASKTTCIDWKQTFINALSLPQNKVYNEIKKEVIQESTVKVNY
jgi:hypothetical protein